MRKKRIIKTILLALVLWAGSTAALMAGYRLYYSIPKDGNPSFTHKGDAGSLYLSNGYSVALDHGSAWDTGRGQQIVDADYDALLSKIYVASDGRLIAEPDGHTYTINCVLDHDGGIPPALVSNQKSDRMWIKDADGNVTEYQQIKAVVTGDRATDDFHLVVADGKWDIGTNVLTKEYISDFADPDTVLAFVTCKDDGREIFFWEPVKGSD